MSTLPGVASKAEKGKSKYQSLDINNLYKVYTTEPSETQQPKNTLPRKHGMQSLGKVPTARRPPANLPSLKSEHTGSDAAVSLVPSGGPGWGKQEPHSPSSTTPPSITSVPNSNTTSPGSANVQLNTQQPPTVVPVPPIPPSIKHHLAPTATAVTADKSWSAIMSGADIFQPPPYQSPQFQHEFPSLSAGDGAPPRIGVDTQYGPGPSLRPQTEGSWIQGGVRPGMETIPKGNSVPLAPPPQLSGQAGHVAQQQPLPPQFRGVMPPFMYRGNFTQNGPVGPNFASIPGSISNGRNPAVDNRAGARRAEDESLHRPIIKEEELNRMDDMSRDVGWASHDDIDYNQKLAFSDDESEVNKNNKKASSYREHDKTDHNSHDIVNKNNWSTSKSGSNNTQSISSQGNKNRSNEEDEVWVQRRRQQSEEVAIAVERAKQRKEEEEKRFLETKQAAAKKLLELEEKISKCKLDKEIDESQGTISPSVVPPQPITPVPIPVPDWEKEKDVKSRPLGFETFNNKIQYRESSDFRKLTQIDARSFIRKEIRSSERDTRDRDQSGLNFSKQFQSNLPPRFLKQLRPNTPSTPQSPSISNSSSNIMMSDQHEGHWQQNPVFNKNVANSHKTRLEVEDNELRQDIVPKDSKSSLDDNYGGSHNNYSDVNRLETTHEEIGEYKKEDYGIRKDMKKDGKWEKDIKSEKKNFKQTVFEDHRISYHGNERDKIEEKYQDRYERPQRPDSRDSRTSRESRHSRESEPRDYHGSWADSSYEPLYDDRRKEHYKEDRRSVPGPITRDRIEADDLKSEKKNLTQLKRGYVPDKRSLDIKKNLEVAEKVIDDGWTIPKRDNTNNETKTPLEVQPLKITAPDNIKSIDIVEKPKTIVDTSKSEDKFDQLDNKKDDKERRPISSRRHADSRQVPWGTREYVYPRSWSKRSDSSRRGARNGIPRKSIKSGETHGTDSDVSAEDVSTAPSKKLEKEEKNKEIKHEKPLTHTERKMEVNKKDNYLPRGEPSRHGRGAGNFRNRGGLGKRIDGYGPPPSKSPFSQLEDKKLLSEDYNPSDTASSDEKTKQNQQALSAGIIGSNRSSSNKDSNSLQLAEEGMKSVTNNQSLKKENCSMDNWDTSENSDECSIKEQKSVNKFGSLRSSSEKSSMNSVVRKNNPPPRFNNEKRNYNPGLRQNSSSSLKSSVAGSGKILDDSKNKIKSNEELKLVCETDSTEKVCDSDGFQEVKSKKTGVRQKSADDKPVNKPVVKPDKPIERKKSNGPLPTLTPEQIANLPSLMDTPINPPVIVPNLSNKNQYDRLRQNKLPPRFAKQRENSRLQKVQMQQGMCDLNDMNIVNHNMSVYSVNDPQNSVSARICNAWEKPLTNHVRTEQEVMLNICMDSAKTVEHPQQSISPNTDKAVKTNHITENAVLDGTTPLVNTIIFENTNFKTGPSSRSSRSDKSSTNEPVIDPTAIPSFNKPVIRDVLNKNEKQSESMDMNDMKLDFFESEISRLTDDKSSKNLALPRSMHAITSVSNNTLSALTTDALNDKIASVKRVWENVPSGIEHSVGQDDSNSSFSSSFGTDPNTLDSSAAFAKSSETVDDAREGYPSSPIQNPSNNTTNVCKVKPTQQVSSGGQSVHIAGAHPQHTTIVGPGIVGHPLSPPPPMPPVLGGGVSLGQPPQQYTSSQHLSYQPNLGGNNQYGMSAIPSPPTVLFNSSPQIQAAQTGLYGAYQLDQAQVLSSQGRTQYSQYPFGLGQAATSPYSAQSMYPHPTAGQPPPDLYQNLNNYRYGQGQQLTNPSTVLISSTSNSLMSATVKPTTQQMSAIGTKANGAGQAYQQQSQQGQQLYMTYEPTLQANYLQNTGVMQRSTAPLQNNVVPTIQPSSSYFPGSTGGQTSFFQQPASSTLQSPQLSHTGYSLQGNVFGNHNQSHASAGLQNFGSHFLSNPMQIAAAAALSAQQYRSSNLQNSPYIKSISIGEQGTRPQQIKSPSSQQDVLSSVFNTGPQIPSPKSRQNMKQAVPQPNSSAQLKYNLYQTVGNQSQAPRFPTPIQRPVNFQATLGAMHGNTGPSNNPKHRSAVQNNKLSGHNYYRQGNNLSATQNDKGEDVKLGDTVTPNSSNSAIVSNTTSIVTKAIITTNSTITVNQTTEIKETSTNDESSVIKD